MEVEVVFGHELHLKNKLMIYVWKPLIHLNYFSNQHFNITHIEVHHLLLPMANQYLQISKTVIILHFSTLHFSY